MTRLSLSPSECALQAYLNMPRCAYPRLIVSMIYECRTRLITPFAGIVRSEDCLSNKFFEKLETLRFTLCVVDSILIGQLDHRASLKFFSSVEGCSNSADIAFSDLLSLMFSRPTLPLHIMNSTNFVWYIYVEPCLALNYHRFRSGSMVRL